jgi:hypothetical protein
LANPEHLEPLTLNQRVPGSSPGAPTTQAIANTAKLSRTSDGTLFGRRTE